MKILLILLLPVLVQGQKYQYEQPKLKAYAPSIALTFLSGMADGTRDASIFYHIKNGGYFDGRESWRNKYRNGDYQQGPAYFGSTNILAWTTDGAHLMSTVGHTADAWAFVMKPNDNNRRFGHLLLQATAMMAARSAGHFLMYSIVIPNQNREIR